MFKRLQNDRGYALFLTMLIIIVFGVLSVMLLTVVVSGANKNVVREQVTQASELSEKGIEHISNQVHNDLEAVINTYSTGIDKESFLNEMVNIFDKYACDNPGRTPIKNIGEELFTGEYDTCIEKVENSEGPYAELRKQVTFKSIGIVDGKEKIIRTTMLIGAKDVPDALNYALGAHECEGSNCGSLPGEGNLYLHGGVTIQGDMKVDRHLVTFDRGRAYFPSGAGEVWIQSVKPEAKPGPNSTRVKSQLVLGGNVYTMRNTTSYSDHLKRTNFDSNNTYRKSTLEEAFSTAPELANRDPIKERIVISDYSSDYYFGQYDTGVERINGTNLQNIYYPNNRVHPYRTSGRSNRIDGDYTLRGNNTFKGFATGGNLFLRGNSGSTANFSSTSVSKNSAGEYESGIYVQGNLSIGNTSTTSDNPNHYEKIRLRGPIYVNGNLEIIGADAEFDALIYVNGEVTIRNSRINGITENGRESSLIVFANKNIHIANISVNQNEPSKIRGFFYSNEAFEMYGVGSNIRIEGGISARRIALNAIRGRASENSNNVPNGQAVLTDVIFDWYSFSYKYYYTYFENPNNQPSRDSRLQVIHNAGLLENYSDLQQSGTLIKNLDPPELISRD